MKKILLLVILMLPFLNSCQKQKVWEFEVLPNTCYGDAFYFKPSFQPRSFVLEMKGTLNQDVTVLMSGTQPNTDGPGRHVGFNTIKHIKAGPLNFSDSAEIYVEDFKIIISGSDTTLYPNPESKGTFRCLPLGDIKVKITLQ